METLNDLVAEINAFIHEHPKPFVKFWASHAWGSVTIELHGYHMNKSMTVSYPLPNEVLTKAEDREEIYRVTMEHMYTNALRDMFVFEGWRKEV